MIFIVISFFFLSYGEASLLVPLERDALELSEVLHYQIPKNFLFNGSYDQGETKTSGVHAAIALLTALDKSSRSGGLNFDVLDLMRQLKMDGAAHLDVVLWQVKKKITVLAEDCGLTVAHLGHITLSSLESLFAGIKMTRQSVHRAVPSFNLKVWRKFHGPKDIIHLIDEHFQTALVPLGLMICTQEPCDSDELYSVLVTDFMKGVTKKGTIQYAVKLQTSDQRDDSIAYDLEMLAQGMFRSVSQIVKIEACGGEGQPPCLDFIENATHPYSMAEHVYAVSGDFFALNQLLMHEPHRANTYYAGKTPLLQSVHSPAITQLLVKRGADLEAEWQGWTPLMYAIRQGYLETVQILLKSGAAIVAQDYDQITLLTHILQNKNFLMLELLIHNGIILDKKISLKWAPLWRAIKNRDLDRVRFLVENGALLESQCLQGITPFWYAIFKRYFEIADFLLEKKVKIDPLDQQDRVSPLFMASYRGEFEIVQFLVERRANLEIRDSGGVTPLWVAAQNGYKEIVYYLQSQGACLEVKNFPFQATPLWVAAQNGHLEIVQYLVDHQADLSIRTTTGASLLWIAAQNGYLEIVQYLWRHGASVDDVEQTRGTALQAAQQGGHSSVVQFLKIKGAQFR